jgi:SH3-like domain-containing protein
VGDGRNFATVADAALHEGQSVELVKRRGDWLQVRTQSGQTGWLSSPAVETI